MLTLRADLKAASGAVFEAVQIEMPEPLSIVEAGTTRLAWMSPDEALLICAPDDLDRYQIALADALAGTHHLLVDVSDMRAVFRLHGARVREVLAKLVPFDLDPAVFAPGRFRRTHLGQVAAAVWMPATDEAVIMCFRSVAVYVETALRRAADPRAAMADYRK
jgi:sarcosine oxidase subunit gamma